MTTGRGSRLPTPTYGTRAIYTQHSRTIQTMSDFYVFYSFPVQRHPRRAGATPCLSVRFARQRARDNDRHAVGPRRAREVNSGHEFHDFPGGFRRKTLTRKARGAVAIRLGRDRGAVERIGARRKRVFVAAAMQERRARLFVEETPRHRKNGGIPGLLPGLDAPPRLPKPENFVGLSVFITHDKIPGGRRPLRLPSLSWILSRPSIAHGKPSITHDKNHGAANGLAPRNFVAGFCRGRPSPTFRRPSPTISRLSPTLDRLSPTKNRPSPTKCIIRFCK